jgi:predicted small secreted protein
MRIMIAIALVAAMAGCSTVSGIAADLQAASDGIAERAVRN